MKNEYVYQMEYNNEIILDIAESNKNAKLSRPNFRINTALFGEKRSYMTYHTFVTPDNERTIGREATIE